MNFYPFCKTSLLKNPLSLPSKNRSCNSDWRHSRVVLHRHFHHCHQSWEGRLTGYGVPHLHHGNNLPLPHLSHSSLAVQPTLKQVPHHHFHPFRPNQNCSILAPNSSTRMSTRELHHLYPSRQPKKPATLDTTLVHILTRSVLSNTPISSPGTTMSAPLVLLPDKTPSP